MSTMAAHAHTYYLARWDCFLGVHADNPELCALLKREWTKRGRDAAEPTIVDGFSAWLDRKGAVHLCLIRQATAQMLHDESLAREFLPYLEAPLTSEAAKAAPEHPPS